VEAGRVIKVAAWYSDTAEMVLITNSGTDEAMLQLQLQRAGNIRVPATRFVLDREHPQIAADTVGLIAGQQNYSAQVRVPRDSVVGVRVHADANTR
jgi:hypothetical protein